MEILNRSEVRYFRTGDLGSIRSDGLVTVSGRRDDVFKVGAEKVDRHSIEQALQSDIGRARILRVAGHSSGVRTNAGAFCGLHGYGKFAFTSSTGANREEQASAALYAVDDVVGRKNLAETAERQARQTASDARILPVSGSLCQAKLI